MNIEIKSWATGRVLFSGDFESLKHAVMAAISVGADLRNADLRNADLRDADLRDADLRYANLCGADLCGADLFDSDLSDAIFDPSPVSPEQAIKNLDVVAEIILNDPKTLYMDHWHETDEWKSRTCAEEAVCGTTHCLAGWLQVCATDQKVRAFPAYLAGFIQAPQAVKMFFKSNEEVIDWLKNREYAKEET